jgi:hypoxanthine-guanine phosphoribosyltransferase
VSAKQQSSYSPKRISARIDELGRLISRAYRGRRVDVVVTMDRGLVFAADLLRNVVTPTVCHLVREEVRDEQQGTKVRRETASRGVTLEPDYFGFQTASN